ncbi:MAG TPA: MerR family transcriptional regulator [Hyphomicrobiaceae bacterium]
MPKAIDAFRNISEVSQELGVKKHVLRFWETRFPQLRPMKRGGGRRYYRPADVELLRGIRHLLQAEGYSVRGVQKILREGGAEHVKRMGKGAPPAQRRVLARARPAAAPQPQVAAPGLVPPLNAAHVGVLRDVVAELAALQAMLRDAEGGERADTGPMRVTTRG